jgi:hypothetical protein
LAHWSAIDHPVRLPEDLRTSTSMPGFSFLCIFDSSAKQSRVHWLRHSAWWWWWWAHIKDEKSL